MNIYGTNGRDTLIGTRDADLFDGRDGSDIYFIDKQTLPDTFVDTGSGDNDMIVAGQDDLSIGLQNGFSAQTSGIEVIASGGFDRVEIWGSEAADQYDFSGITLLGIRAIEMGKGNDTVRGTAGADDIRGSNGDDVVQGGGGADTLQGGSGNDLKPDRDSAHGQDGRDRIAGGSGNDLIAGGSNNDTLSGDSGNDTLVGGSGADQLTGGDGADVFAFWLVTDGPGDVITDFVPGQDRIDLSQIDARAGFPGDQTLVLAGQSSSVVANSVTWSNAGGGTVLRIDVTGDTTADFELRFASAVSLNAADFIL